MAEPCWFVAQYGEHMFAHGYCGSCLTLQPAPKEFVPHKPYKTLCEHPEEARYTGVVCGEEVTFCNFCTERVQ